MNRRKLAGPLTPTEVRLISDASHMAATMGCPLTAFLTVHAGCLAEPPADVSPFLRRDIVNRIGNWLRVRGVPWVALWVRENFEGANREHIHLLIHIPSSHRSAFQRAVRRWWPADGAADVQRVYNIRRVVRYISKQMSTQAAYATCFQVRRQKQCDRTGAKVASVLGRRVGMSQDLRDALGSRGPVLLGTSPSDTNAAPGGQRS